MAYTTINKGSDYFNTVTWSGNGSTQSITGVNFQPDTVWLKCRDAIRDHHVYDVIRTAGERIYTNLTNAEDTTASGLTSFDSDGFSLGSDDSHNGSGKTYVGWSWLGGGAGSSNTDGSITSTVSANTTSGFSIVKYVGISPTAGTVGHGLGVAPKVILFKNLSRATNWDVYHYSTGAGNRLYLNATDASTPATNYMNNTAPTSSVFSVGDADDTNKLNDNIIAYCFAEKKGFSKFGSYTGNGSTDGTFVYTGFAPAFVIFKINSASGDWTLLDNKRNTYNVRNTFLRPNADIAEVTSTVSNNIDFLSNGFKLKQTNADSNGSGYSYIYMAFAESPLVTSNGLPANAR